MSEFEAWIADCYVRDANADGEKQGQAAVWADRAEEFRAALTPYLEAKGLKILWIEECLQASEYLARHPKEQKRIGQLARSVHPHNRVELSKLSDRQNGEEEAPESYLIIEEIEGVEPLDMQMGVHTRKTVPDALLEPLFGQPAPTKDEINHYGSAENVPAMKTYAILDAAKMSYLLTAKIEASDLKYQSLFQGKSQEELKEVAPYLVELEQNNKFTESLFTGPDGVNGLWDKNLGIYIRSRADFDDIRKHFRKFTKLQNENGKWYYFNLSDFSGIKKLSSNVSVDDSSIARRMFSLTPIDFNFTILGRSNYIFYAISRNLSWDNNVDQDNDLIIKNTDMSALSELRKEQIAHDVAQDMFEAFPDYFADLNLEDTQKIAFSTIKKMSEFGFVNSQQLRHLAAWGIFYGDDFVKKDKSNQLINICRSDLAPADKFSKFAMRMHQLKV